MSDHREIYVASIRECDGEANGWQSITVKTTRYVRADILEAKDAEIERLKAAIQSYAAVQPLDTIPPSKLQHDLHSIAGAGHIHVASIGSDRCLICRHDLRHEIHLREGSV